MEPVEEQKLFSPWYDGMNGLHVRFCLRDHTYAQLMWDSSWRGFIVNKSVSLKTFINQKTGEEHKVWDVWLERGTEADTYRLARRTIERCFQKYLADLIVRA